MSTFTQAGASLTYNGAKLYYKLTYVAPGSDPIKASFLQLKINYYEVKETGLELLGEITQDRSDLEAHIKSVQNGDPTISVSQHLIEIPFGNARSIRVQGNENGSGVNDQDFTDKDLTIQKPPSAPKIELLNPVFTTNGNAVSLSGSLKVTPVLGEGTSIFQILVTGVAASDGKSFSERLGRETFTPTESAPSYTVDLSESKYNITKLKDLKADSTVKISVRCQANDYDGPFSQSISADASIRLVSPVLTSVKSLQDKKITVNGTIQQRPANNTTRKYSILAQKSERNVALSASAWMITDVMNVDVPVPTGGASPQNVSFTKDITKINSVANNTSSSLVDFVSGDVYAFIAVQHDGAFTVGKSIDISIPTTDTTAPPLTQSKASNQKMGVTLALVDKSYKFVSGTQNYDSVSKVLSFTPGFLTSSSGALPTTALPNDSNYIYEYIFSSSKKTPSKIDSARNAGGISTVPNIFVDKAPITEDVYTLTATISYMLSDYALQSIENSSNEPSLYIHPDLSNANTKSSVLVATYSSTTKKGRTAEDVPLLKGLDLGITMNKDGVRKLVASWIADYDASFKIQNVHLEVMKGFSGSASSGANSFTPLVLNSASGSGFPTQVSASINSADVADVYVFNDVGTVSGTPLTFSPAVLSGSFTVRARAVVADKQNGDNSIISGWAYDSYEVDPVVMNGPTLVSIAPVAASVGKSFNVAFTTPAKTNINANSVPSTWGTSYTVILKSALVSLFDNDSKLITSKVYTFSDAENATFITSTVVVSGVAFTELQNLVAGSNVYAEVQITYAKKDSTLVQAGAKSDRNLSYVSVSPSISVTEVSLSQDPAVVIAGNRKVNDVGMTSLKVSAKINLNGLSTADANVTAVISAAASQGGANAVTHTMTYDSSLETWVSGVLYPNIAVNYKTAVVLVLANHAGSSNVTTYGVLP
jgi:hypothetical protein